MQITKNQIDELNEMVEDMTALWCNQEFQSGEAAWNLIWCLATAKVAEFEGLVSSDPIDA